MLFVGRESAWWLVTAAVTVTTGHEQSRELGCHMAGDGGVGDMIGGLAGCDHVGE
jgi:hypothetical protein